MGMDGKIGGGKRVFTINREQLAMNHYGDLRFIEEGWFWGSYWIWPPSYSLLHNFI